MWRTSILASSRRIWCCSFLGSTSAACASIEPPTAKIGDGGGRSPMCMLPMSLMALCSAGAVCWWSMLTTCVESSRTSPSTVLFCSGNTFRMPAGRPLPCLTSTCTYAMCAWSTTNEFLLVRPPKACRSAPSHCFDLDALVCMRRSLRYADSGSRLTSNHIAVIRVAYSRSCVSATCRACRAFFAASAASAAAAAAAASAAAASAASAAASLSLSGFFEPLAALLEPALLGFLPLSMREPWFLSGVGPLTGGRLFLPSAFAAFSSFLPLELFLFASGFLPPLPPPSSSLLLLLSVDSPESLLDLSASDDALLAVLATELLRFLVAALPLRFFFLYCLRILVPVMWCGVSLGSGSLA